MKIHRNHAEEDLAQTLQALHSEREFWLVLRINLSQIAHCDKDTQDIVLNIVRSDFDQYRGKVFCLDNLDILFLAPLAERSMLLSAESRIRHLFIYDPLVCNPSLGQSFSNFAVLIECYEGLLTECHRSLLQSLKSDETIRQRKKEINHAAFSKAVEARKGRSRMQIMIVEDHPFIRKMIARTLESDVEIIQASNGYDALEFYCRTAPDIVFLDIEMPEMNGHEVLRSLTSLDPDAFIIMLTAKRSCESVLKAKELHAQGYVMKPFTRVKLQQCVQQYKSKHERDPHAKSY